MKNFWHVHHIACNLLENVNQELFCFQTLWKPTLQSSLMLMIVMILGTGYKVGNQTQQRWPYQNGLNYWSLRSTILKSLPVSYFIAQLGNQEVIIGKMKAGALGKSSWYLIPKLFWKELLPPKMQFVQFIKGMMERKIFLQNLLTMLSRTQGNIKNLKQC